MGDIKSNLKAAISSETARTKGFGDGGDEAYFGFMNALSEEGEIDEKWSEKYKKSIDCKNPKGFSQRAHCQGKKKKQENKEATGAASAGGYNGPLFGSIKRKIKEELLRGGKSDGKTIVDLHKKHFKKGMDSEKLMDSLKNQLRMGMKIESEHTDNEKQAEEIALDHLYENPTYYSELKKIETKEATGSGSAGSYVTPAAWAKSTSKKHWRGRSKTQIPGGKFVTVKKKCKTFPYCNQGDTKALKIYENEVVKNVISKISKENQISENVIKSIIQYEIEKFKNNSNK